MATTRIAAISTTHSTAQASTSPVDPEAEKKRQERIDKLPTNVLTMGGLATEGSFAMRKMAGSSTALAGRNGMIAGAIVAGSYAASEAVRYLRTGEHEGPEYLDKVATGAEWALKGVAALALFGMGTPMYGPLPFVKFGVRAAAETHGAAGGGAVKGALGKYSKDLTEAARNGEIGRAFGVDDKVDELVAVLGASRKNNPLIVGPAGTGKTALVEELAHRIALDQVPDHLKGVRIVQIDLDAMVAGTKYRGSFEERLTSVLTEIDAAEGKVIPFIDETHKLVNAGAANEAEGAGEAVKPLLARGRIRLIGATTDAADEIGIIHADPALARRFTEIGITAPDSSSTLNILRQSASRYEQGGVRFTDDALSAIVEATDPIAGRNQPDKAITLLDTLASRMSISRDAKPQPLKALDTQIAGIKAELGIVSRETSATAQARTEALTRQLTDLEPKARAIEAEWMAARAARDELATVREHLASAAGSTDEATLAAQVSELEASMRTQEKAFPSLFRTEITRQDVLGSGSIAGAAQAATPAATGEPKGLLARLLSQAFKQSG